jgi:hypothetical protein
MERELKLKAKNYLIKKLNQGIDTQSGRNAYTAISMAVVDTVINSGKHTDIKTMYNSVKIEANTIANNINELTFVDRGMLITMIDSAVEIRLGAFRPNGKLVVKSGKGFLGMFDLNILYSEKDVEDINENGYDYTNLYGNCCNHIKTLYI